MFWELLNGLAKLDDKPWPSTVPRDSDTDKLNGASAPSQAHALCAGRDHGLPAKVNF